MFTKHICEGCGRKFDSMKECQLCEEKHAEERIAAEAAETERTGKLDEIKAIEALLKGKIDAYEKEYGLKVESDTMPQGAKTTKIVSTEDWEMFWEELLRSFYGFFE